MQHKFNVSFLDQVPKHSHKFEDKGLKDNRAEGHRGKILNHRPIDIKQSKLTVQYLLGKSPTRVKIRTNSIWGMLISTQLPA